MIILYSTAAFALGFILDLIIGDPPGFPHIVRVIGLLISALERNIRRSLPKTPRGELIGGAVLTVTVIAVCFLLPFIILRVVYAFSVILGILLEGLLCFQLLAVRCLRDESMKVYYALASGDTALARDRIAMLVGRDTDTLDEEGITRAAVETVAENASDGIIAPMLYILAGGAALGCLYKAVNTMDSMLGYKNERYMYFGRASAKLDDALNYIPSRISAVIMLISAAFLGLDTKNALKVWRRDRRKHDSPNSAQTESVCAGALGIRLAGPIKYFGVTRDKPYIGDELRVITHGDIKHVNSLLYASAVITFILSLLVRGAAYAAI